MNGDKGPLNSSTNGFPMGNFMSEEWNDVVRGGSAYWQTDSAHGSNPLTDSGIGLGLNFSESLDSPFKQVDPGLLQAIPDLETSGSIEANFYQPVNPLALSDAGAQASTIAASANGAGIKRKLDASPHQAPITAAPNSYVSSTSQSPAKRLHADIVPKQERQDDDEEEEELEQHDEEEEGEGDAITKADGAGNVDEEEVRAYKTQMDTIKQIVAVEAYAAEQLTQMRRNQRRLIEGLVVDRTREEQALVQMISLHEELTTQLTTAEETLQQLNENEILVPQAAWEIYQLTDSLRLHSTQLRLYKDELTEALATMQSNPRALHPRPLIPLAALVITSQPFPSYLIQGKAIDSPIKVTVYTSSTVDEVKGLQGEPVRAELINQDYTPTAGAKGKTPKAGKSTALPSIQYGHETLENGEASFASIMFPRGTRVKTINMSFQTRAALNGRPISLQSDMTKPFIVMTNHGQASMAGGRLFKKHTFQDMPEVTWQRFANFLQLHYLHVTKQDFNQPERPLSFHDMRFLHSTRFSGKATINHDDFNKFWKWFGTILRKISNNQKHMQDMWMKGLIYGFISRVDTERLLGMMDVGSFVIRFSERNAGLFVVAYKNGTGLVKQCLVTEEEEKKSSTLPNYLRDMGEDLWCVIQLHREKKSGRLALVPRRKDDVIAPYYDKCRASSAPFGYETEIRVGYGAVLDAQAQQQAQQDQ